MFKSREKPTFLEKLQAFFWPRAGWKRSSKYVAHRVARIPGSPYSIAAGFACGAAISFTPFVGAHLIFGALLAYVIRGSMMAAWIGTLVGNPWTFPFIWIFIYKLGIWMGANGGVQDDTSLNFLAFFDELIEAVKTLDWTYVFDIAWPVFWPMIIGGIPCFFISWILFFFPIRYLVEKYHARRALKRQQISI